jgi:alpha-beta hydrolase superfamily lysophospholipase
MDETTFQHRSRADGLDLLVRGFVPPSPRAVVHVLHGMAEHSARYARLAGRLADGRFAVYVHDHRGHGKSVSKALPLGHLADENAWRRMVDDARVVGDVVAARHPDLPRLLFAHSMGSFVAQQLLWQEPGRFRGVALSGSNGKPPAVAHVGRLVARLERVRVGPAAPSGLIQALSFGQYNRPFAPNRTDFDWLSRDPDEVDKYVADPECGFPLSTRSWIDFLDALGSLTAPANLAKIPRRAPIYIFSGDEDPVGENGVGVRRLRDAYVAAGIDRVELRLYRGARHETLNETNREEVMADLRAFFESVLE